MPGEGRAKGSSSCFYLGQMRGECSPGEKMVSRAGRPRKAAGSSENPSSFMLQKLKSSGDLPHCVFAHLVLLQVFVDSLLCALHDSRHYGKLRKREKRVLLISRSSAVWFQ